ncbi:MAG TPA: restriction endonuclease subunit S [Lacunisphaera sp.]
MDLSTFFRKFDQFADAPDAVSKLRELVLELAASGRLMSEELERPVEEDTKMMGPLVELVMGQAPAGTECNTDGRGTVFVKVGEFGPLYPREEVWTTDPLKFAKKGDVLVCVVGATVGKLNLAIDCAIGRSVAAIRPSPALDTRFLYYSLIPYTLHLRRNSRGSAQGVIGKAELNVVSLWVPSREVQNRIVAKLDELMALCDRLEAQQQERESRARGLARAALARFAAAPTPANLHLLFHFSFCIPPSDLRKSILTLAVQGKLVPQDPNDEPAERLLKVAGKSQMNGSGETGGPPFPLPPGWNWLSIAGAFEVAGGIQKTPHRTPRKNAYPYLGVGNVYRGRLDLTNVKEFELEPGELERRRLEVGDLLIIEGNGSFSEIGRCAKWTGEIKDCVHQNHVIRCRPCDARISDFVLLFLNSPNGIEIMQRLAITSSGLYSLSVGKIRQIEIPIPPLAEQRRIVAKVEQLMALVDALEQQLAASRATAEKLLTALVAELTAA